MADRPDGLLIPPRLAAEVIEAALAHGGEFAEVYAEERSGLSLALDDRRVERAQVGRELGASVRVIAGDSTYFGHVDGLGEADLRRLAESVAGAVRGKVTRSQALRAVEIPAGQEIEQPPGEVPAERKAQLLRECDERARAFGDEIAQVSAGYNEQRRRVQVANSEGLTSGDDRTRLRLGAQVVARRGDRVETGA